MKYPTKGFERQATVLFDLRMILEKYEIRYINFFEKHTQLLALQRASRYLFCTLSKVN